MHKRITYHVNGNKCEEGFYKDGRREGECISYYENCEKELAAETAVAAVKQHQRSGRRLKEVIFCCFDEENFQLYIKLLNNY